MEKYVLYSIRTIQYTEYFKYKTWYTNTFIYDFIGFHFQASIEQNQNKSHSYFYPFNK